jgi:hypothetical protein
MVGSTIRVFAVRPILGPLRAKWPNFGASVSGLAKNIIGARRNLTVGRGFPHLVASYLTLMLEGA